jgi:hypothetical protein
MLAPNKAKQINKEPGAVATGCPHSTFIHNQVLADPLVEREHPVAIARGSLLISCIQNIVPL